MRKKGALILLLVAVMLTTQMVLADDIYEKTTMSLYQGGWNHKQNNKGKHWTSYSVNAPETVEAYITVLSNPTEIDYGLGSARIESQYLAGPYDYHKHDKNTPSYLIELWGLPEFTPIERDIK